MKIINEKLLNLFRRGGPCEHCKRMTARRQPHHIFCRGLNSARRLDVTINLISLCVQCHNDFHNGRILRCDLLAIVATRERRLQGDIEAEIYELRRRPKP